MGLESLSIDFYSLCLWLGNMEVVYKIFHKINDNKLNAEPRRCREHIWLCISATLRSIQYFASKIHFSFFRKPRNLVIDAPDLFYTRFISQLLVSGVAIFFIKGILYDKRTLKKIHKAIWLGTFFIISGIAFTMAMLGSPNCDQFLKSIIGAG